MKVLLLMFLVATFTLVSCGNDDEPDSDTDVKKNHVELRFIYTEKFGNEEKFGEKVKSVAVYFFDERDIFVRKFEESGDKLSKEGYTLSIDGLEPGVYSCVAWCGIKDRDDKQADFNITGVKEGVTTRADMVCRMNAIISEEAAYSSADLNDLFYGAAFGVKIPEKKESGDYTYVINLTQDTKEVTVIVYDESLNTDNFVCRIQASNATLDASNNPVGEEKIIYQPYSCEKGKLPGRDEGATIFKFKIGRLMAKSNTILTLAYYFNPESPVITTNLPEYIRLNYDYSSLPEAAHAGEQEFFDQINEYTIVYLALPS